MLKKIKSFKTNNSKSIRLRYLLTKYDLAETDTQKKRILKLLNNKVILKN